MENNELNEKLSELTEHCGHCAKLFIKVEMCIKNGVLADAQKYTMEAQNLLGVMTKDVFLEIAECFEMETEECAEIEDINTLEIAKHLCDITYNVGVLNNLIIDNVDEKICVSVKTKILSDINACKKLYTAIFDN